MKKILLIVFLSLLLSNNTYAQKIVFNCSYDSSYSSGVSQTYYILDPKNKYFEMKYNYKGTNYIISNTNGRLQYFEMDNSNVTYEIEGLKQRYAFNFADNNFKDQPIKKSKRNKKTIIYCTKNTMLSGKPISLGCEGDLFAVTCAKNTMLSVKPEKQNTSNNTDNKITKSKKICKELGFKANSEKFADCALKMMALQFETGNKVSNSDGSTTQKIIVKQQDNYNIGDAFSDLQKIIDNNYRSNNSNSSNTSSQRCKIYERAWGADMVCQ